MPNQIGFTEVLFQGCMNPFLKEISKYWCFRKMASEVEETLKRLVSHKGVIGTIVVNNEGVRHINWQWIKNKYFLKVPIKSTLDNATTVQYSGLLNNLVDQAKTMFKELDPTNDLTFLRIRTKVKPFLKLIPQIRSKQFYPWNVNNTFLLFQKHEIMVAPDRDYLLIVIQNTQDA